jgi:hypothetical protein
MGPVVCWGGSDLPRNSNTETRSTVRIKSCLSAASTVQAGETTLIDRTSPRRTGTCAPSALPHKFRGFNQERFMSDICPRCSIFLRRSNHYSATGSFLKKLIVAQPVNTFSALITVFTKPHEHTPTFSQILLILLHRSASGIFASGFLTKILYVFFISSMRAKCHPVSPSLIWPPS